MLTVRDFAEQMGLRVVAGEGGLDGAVTGMYMGDLLSWVIGKAKEGDAWVTIQGHVNIVAVALLTVVSCIIVCEAAEINEQTIIKANEEDVPILAGQLPTFETALKYITITQSAA